MRRFFAGLLWVLGVAPLGASAAQAEEAWSGAYRLEWIDAGKTGAEMRIAPAPDADPAKLVEKYRADLTRWTISQPVSGQKGATLRRFLSSQYEAFGWGDLREAARIECLDANRLFVCRTDPGTTISFGPDRPNRETLVARTGVFGVILHAGAFELKKLD